MLNRFEKAAENAINALQDAGYRLLIIFHPSEPTHKRIFIISEFNEARQQVEKHTLMAQEITDWFGDGFLNFLNAQSVTPDHIQRQNIETKLDSIPKRKYQFSKDYSWELLI